MTNQAKPEPVLTPLQVHRKELRAKLKDMQDEIGEFCTQVRASIHCTDELDIPRSQDRFLFEMCDQLESCASQALHWNHKIGVELKRTEIP